jgi:hypothetical protein
LPASHSSSRSIKNHRTATTPCSLISRSFGFPIDLASCNGKPDAKLQQVEFLKRSAGKTRKMSKWLVAGQLLISEPNRIWYRTRRFFSQLWFRSHRRVQSGLNRDGLKKQGTQQISY